MNWYFKYKADIHRYTQYSKGSALVQCFTQQGLWALLAYRMSSAIYISRLPKHIKRILLIGCVIWQKFIEITTGISIPYTADIGAGLYIGHYGGIILHPVAQLGENCNISQGVTIGISGRGNKRGVPVIGNRVYVGVNAVIAGKIRVGDDVVIGANSLVNRDVPRSCTVVGVPATIVSQRGSSDYIFPVDL